MLVLIIWAGFERVNKVRLILWLCWEELVLRYGLVSVRFVKEKRREKEDCVGLRSRHFIVLKWLFDRRKLAVGGSHSLLPHNPKQRLLSSTLQPQNFDIRRLLIR